MREFSVWAPKARQVELELEGRRVPMRATGGGWWRADADAADGARYRFSLDGGPPLPDPRSPYQPEGVHGPSQVVDHRAFGWSDQGFRAPPLSSAVIYELHVGTFSPDGTFAGVAERLDYLAQLGVTHVELMPVNAFPGRHGWGYDGVALFAPHAAYGAPEDLKRLVDACHRRGLAVLLDVVYNHLGPDGNYLGQYGPYFTDVYSTPWGDAVNFDGPGSDEVRRFVCDNALMWLRDYHVDGLRIDAIHAILDRSATHILEQLAAEVDTLEAQLARPLALIAESDLNDPRVITSREAGGYGIDAQWSDDFHHAIHTALTGERTGYYADFGDLAQLARALEHGYVYAGEHSAYRGRRHGRPLGALSGHRLLGYCQNHDQVGNRARGERLTELAGTERAKIAAALVLTAPFVPMLFMGEEWGASSPFPYFTDHTDPELADAVRRGRRSEFEAFGWLPDEIPDPQAPETVASARLDWREAERQPHRSIHTWYRNLLALRRLYPELTNGRRDLVDVRYDEAERWIVVRRGRVTLACNLGDRTRRLDVGPGEVSLTSRADAGTRDGDALQLAANAAVVVTSAG